MYRCELYHCNSVGVRGDGGALDVQARAPERCRTGAWVVVVRARGRPSDAERPEGAVAGEVRRRNVAGMGMGTRAISADQPHRAHGIDEGRIEYIGEGECRESTVFVSKAAV